MKRKTTDDEGKQRDLVDLSTYSARAIEQLTEAKIFSLNVREFKSKTKERTLLMQMIISHLRFTDYDLDTMRYALEEGPPVNQPDVDGFTALHWACTSTELSIPIDDYELVFMLLDHGADPKLKTNEGDTAIELARETGRYHSVFVLENFPLMQVLGGVVSRGLAHDPAVGFTAFLVKDLYDPRLLLTIFDFARK